MIKPTLICLTSLMIFNACSVDVQSGIDAAGELLYRKQYVEAERLYRKQLVHLFRLDRLEPEEHKQRLLVLERLGQINDLYLRNYKQAIADYGQLVKYYPQSDEAFATRAAVADLYQHRLSKPQAAIDEYHKLISEFPRRAEISWAQLQITTLNLRIRKYEQARHEAQMLITKWPDSAETHQARYLIASSYFLQNRYTEAIDSYQSILQDSSPTPLLAALVSFDLANCHQELGQYERSLEYYYESLAHHSNPHLVQEKIRRARRRLQASQASKAIYRARPQSKAPLRQKAHPHQKGG